LQEREKLKQGGGSFGVAYDWQWATDFEGYCDNQVAGQECIQYKYKSNLV